MTLKGSSVANLEKFRSANLHVKQGHWSVSSREAAEIKYNPAPRSIGNAILICCDAQGFLKIGMRSLDSRDRDAQLVVLRTMKAS